MAFDGEPFFGPAACCADAPAMVPDDVPVAVVGPMTAPEAPADPMPDAQAPPEPSTTAFTTRRKPAPPAPERAENGSASTISPVLDVPAPVVVAEPVAAPPPAQAVASIAPNRPADATPDDEADRMTVFGARAPDGPDAVGGKPRHLGLILTAILLLFLAAVAIWASLFLEGGVARLLPGGSDDPGITQNANLPAPRVLHSGPDQWQAPDDGDATAGVAPEGWGTNTSTAPDAPPPPVLSDTDSAVLEALRTPDTAELSNEPDQEETAQADVPTALEAEALYAATGIWQTPPAAPVTPEIDAADDPFIAIIDRGDLSQDAVALPPVEALATDLPAGQIGSPVAAGTQFALDDRGLVIPTAAGALNPEGVLVYLGPPPIVPPETPTRFESTPETTALQDQQNQLALFRPRLRPTDLVEQAERSQLGGLSLAELGRKRPQLRPETLKQVEELDETPTAQAVVVSRMPLQRPDDFAARVARQQQTQVAAASAAAAASVAAVAPAPQTVAPRSVTPNIPSTASVARQATMENAINLRRVNLIGVYGTPSNRRALVLLPNGRYQKVKVGDTVDGGRVVAIGDSELRYQKGGRDLTLKIPSG
jgi:hypothetical protein